MYFRSLAFLGSEKAGRGAVDSLLLPESVGVVHQVGVQSVSAQDLLVPQVVIGRKFEVARVVCSRWVKRWLASVDEDDEEDVE